MSRHHTPHETASCEAHCFGPEGPGGLFGPEFAIT